MRRVTLAALLMRARALAGLIIATGAEEGEDQSCADGYSPEDEEADDEAVDEKAYGEAENNA